MLTLCLVLGSFPRVSQAQPIQDRSARVDSVVEVLQDPTADPLLRQEAAKALGKIGPAAEGAAKPLAKVVRDPTVREYLRELAARALYEIGPEANEAVDPLIAVLQDTTAKDRLRQTAAKALGRIGPPADEPLIAVVQDPTESDAARRWAAAALGGIGPAAEGAAKPLAKVVRDPTVSRDLRGNAFRALLRISPGVEGKEAEKAVGPLIEAVQDTTVSDDLREMAAAGLIRIASALLLKEHVLSDSLLDKLDDTHEFISGEETIFMSRPESVVDVDSRDTDRLESSITGLRNVRSASWRVWFTEEVVKPVSENWYIQYLAGIVAFYFLLLVVWTALLGFRSFWLLRINNGLKQVEGSLSLDIGPVQIKLPLRYGLLVGFFHYHPRVLDAWVEGYLSKARDRFGKLDTVKEREIHISLPLERDDRLLERLAPADLQNTFARNNAFVLIHGEGGAGKTSLACQLARSAMHEDPEWRLCESHRLLPVLIESGFTDFFEAVHARLRYLVGAERPPPASLVKALLRKRRVLVIVDGLSEMSPETREAFQPGAKDFPANALMVTSRIEEPLGNVLKTVLRPLRVEGNRVSDFMSAYLRKRGKRELFPDSVFFNMLSHFSEMVGDRPIPVLLPRLYAEEMIAAREAGSDDLPANIPDLVLRYLNQLNPADPHDNRTVHRVAKRLAWLCLREDFRPSEAPLDDVNEILSDDGLDVVAYLEDRMRILRTVKPAEDRVRFTLDPMAEYLAALHKTDELNGDEEAWWQFLRRVDEMEGEPKATRGFLQAMDDCCRHPDFRETVPDWVPGQLADHAAIETEPARV